MNNSTIDPKVKQIRDKIRDALIERIPQLIEHLDSLSNEEYVKYYFMIAEVVEGRKAIADNNKKAIEHAIQTREIRKRKGKS